MIWEDMEEEARVRFGDREASALGRDGFVPEAEGVAWLRQVHSARVRRAGPGCAGEGDALVTRRRGLALVVVTADCVPVLLAGSHRVGAAHAGWKGIESGVVAATAEQLAGLGGSGGGAERAWIGPHIGPCCYEVSDEVAERLVAVSCREILHPTGSGQRPRVDLGLAVETQLRRAGVGEIRRMGPCTRCAPSLSSYRREGASAGRNLSAIWLDATSPGR